MKRIISIVFILIFATISINVAAINTAIATKSDSEITDVIKLLEIANGDENGNMNYEQLVTRAQFTKMAVSASNSKDAATNSKLNVSLFPDVKSSYWGAGYIAVAINNGLITGYLDGTFKPDANVKLEEAVTVTLKLLGYTNTDFLGPYPKEQMEKYKILGLDTGITAEQGEVLTRRECMQLIYNALSTKTKTGQIYCTTLGYSANADGVIDYNALIETKLCGPVVVDGNNYKKIINFDENKASVIRDGKDTSSSSIKQYDVLYYINEIEKIWTYTDKVFGIVNSVDNPINPKQVTISQVQYAVSGNFSDATALKIDEYVMLVLDRTGKVCKVYSADKEMYNTYHDAESDYLDMISATVTDPVAVDENGAWKKEIPFEIGDNTSITLDGKQISPADIKTNDVVYYSEAFKALIVYRKTATGVVTAVTMQNNSPTAITLTNKNYILFTNAAKEKFGVTGIYSVKNAFVTLLLGKNDAVIDAISGDISKISDNNDNATYLEMVNASISSPILISSSNDISGWQKKIPFEIDETKLYLNGAASANITPKVHDVIYYSEPFESVWLFRDTSSGVISKISSSGIIVGGKNYVLATDSAKFKVSTYGEFSQDDYVTLVLGKDSEVVDIFSASTSDIGNKDNDSSYSEVVSSTLEGPFIVGENRTLSKLSFDIDNATIFKGSGEISKIEIQPYDVYYFSKLLNTVWIYRDAVSGTLEAVTPAISPTSVVVNGKTYKIEASQASYDVSSFGIYHVGDDVTLLLGKDGVSGVISPKTLSGVIYGVVTDIGSKTYTKSDDSTYTAEYVTVTDTSNTTYTYEYDNKYFPVGTIVRVTYADSVRISKITNDSTSTGVAAQLKNAFLNRKFAADCQIIDVNGALTKKIYPSRLKGIDLDISAFTFGGGIVLYHEFDDNGNITKLILDDFTGDLYDYGMVLSSDKTSTRYMTDSSVKSMSFGTAVAEGPAIVRESSIAPLRAYVDVDMLSKTAVYDDDGNEYKLSNDVKVFIKTAGSYDYSSVDDVIDGDYSFTAYYDKSPSRGGLIRVIIAIRAV